MKKKAGLRVAEAIVDSRYLARTHAIQYRAHRLMQVSVSYDGTLFAVSRHPYEEGQPWPAWRSTRGSGCGPEGFYGLWLPHVPDLLCTCTLVRLAANDRPPPHPRYRYSPGGWASEDGAPIPYPGAA